jgi:hypothetical protein
MQVHPLCHDFALLQSNTGTVTDGVDCDNWCCRQELADRCGGCVVGWIASRVTGRLLTFVVFAGRIFRYPCGDASGRAEAAAYGRGVGVPEDQLDWPQ